MQPQFKIDTKYPHVKVFVDHSKEFYIFQCQNCKEKSEFHFDFFKHKFNKSMKEIGEEFLFDHKNCKEAK